jgi:cell division protein FtsQ
LSPVGAKCKKMNAKTTIRKILFIAVWLCIGGSMVSLLLAANSKKNKGQCKDYSIVIKGARSNFFIDKKDVEQLMIKEMKGTVKGKSVAAFNLHALEQKLEHHTWISDAELYFDNRDVLHVTVIEKEPVARVFTTEGNSFYIDSLGRKLPLSDKLSARVPVFTSFPDKKILSAKDSVLLNDVKMTANFIINDPFWMSQVAQVDITPNRQFVMIPVVGHHLVKLGNGENINHKFRRLMIFYKEVMSKTGFDKYKVINVQYKGQVVASKYTDDPKVDTAQLKKNVEKLLQKARDAQNDTVSGTIQVSGKYTIDVDSVNVPATDLSAAVTNNPEKLTNPSPRLNGSSGQAVKSSLPKTVKVNKTKQKEKEKPKAVMPKKPAEESNGGYN